MGFVLSRLESILRFFWGGWAGVAGLALLATL